MAVQVLSHPRHVLTCSTAHKEQQSPNTARMEHMPTLDKQDLRQLLSAFPARQVTSANLVNTVHQTNVMEGSSANQALQYPMILK